MPSFVRFKIFFDFPENVEMALNQWADAQPTGSDMLDMEIVSGLQGKITIVVAYTPPEA